MFEIKNKNIFLPNSECCKQGGRVKWRGMFFTDHTKKKKEDSPNIF
jgi:hypothetical protein